MSHHLGFLYFDDGLSVNEVINHARTIEHLRNASAFCYMLGGPLDPGCDILYLDSCDYTPVTYSTPDSVDTPAPWYDGTPGSPSSNCYGFWIEEWTGLDGAHMRRSTTPSYPRGGSFGTLGQAHRVWKMNVLLFGADATALEDLFRWLEETLIQCCSPGVTTWVRTTCPDGYDDDYGLVHVVDLQLLEGVEWISPPEEQLGCFVRRVSFTLGVGDPCLYQPPVNCLTDEVFPTGSVLIDSKGTTTYVARVGTTNLGITGDLQIDWGGYLDDWTPSGIQCLVSNTTNSNPDFGFRLDVTTDTKLRLRVSLNGSSFGQDSTSDAITDRITASQVLYVRARWSAATGDVNFYTSDDRITWTQVGSTILGTSGSAFPAVGAPVDVGAAVSANFLDGKTQYAAIWDGFSSQSTGEKVIRLEPEDADGAVSWVDHETSRTWTLGTGTPSNTSEFIEEGHLDIYGAGLRGMLGCPVDQDAFADWRLCCNVEGVRFGVAAPVVVIRNNNTESYSPPLRVVGVGDNGSGCVVANNEFFGEVRVSGIPPQSELMVDCARRRVLWRPVGFIRPWEPGYVYLDTSVSALPTYPAIGCYDGMIFVEPTALTSALEDLEVTVDMVGRYGCC